MKKNLTKKLVLKKHTVASLNAEQLEKLRGGVRYNSDDCGGTNDCGNGSGGNVVSNDCVVSMACTKQQKCYYSDADTLCGGC